METRRIISFGTSSFVVSVPKTWIRENKVKKGDLVHIEDRKDELILSLSGDAKPEEPKRILIEVDNKDLRLIRTEIVSAYLNNYDIIDIAGKQLEKNAPQVKSIIRNLTGLEIIQQTATKITAKDLLNLKEISIRTLIRRMDNITRSMIIDSIDCFNNDHFESIYERDLDVNRLVFLAFRVIRAAMANSKLAKHLAMSNLELMYSRDIILRIEKIGDQTKRIARHIRNATALTTEEKKELSEIYKHLMNDYLNAMKAYYKKDILLACQIEITNKDIIDVCSAYKRRNDPVDTSRIIEHFKSMRTAIKNISRGVIGMEENPFTIPTNV
ncbi:phosphate uptake regulator PhoU [Candidatus Woesearchaeota archaeon]|nr:phosphate uptake regulator PhoU [Candidatus Woesearchaeota archaeon]